MIDILLVEDDPYDLELTLRGLGEADLAGRVQVARDGAEALDYLFCEGQHAARHIDDVPRLVLLDLKLPKINGLEVLTRVKSDARTRAIPVVMLTSSQQQSDVERSYLLGVNSYVVKPVLFEGFVRAVRELGTYWMVRNQGPRQNG